MGGVGCEDATEQRAGSEEIGETERAHRRVAEGARRNLPPPPPPGPPPPMPKPFSFRFGLRLASTRKNQATHIEDVLLDPTGLEPLPVSTDLEERQFLANNNPSRRRKKWVGSSSSAADLEPLLLSTDLEQQQDRGWRMKCMALSAPAMDVVRLKRWVVWVTIFVMLMFVRPTIFVDKDYHDFADQRVLFLGIPNTLNVVSSISFSFLGLAGLIMFPKNYFRLCSLRELLTWIVLFVGLTIVGFGSAYYHLNLGNTNCDTLPMIIAFTSTVCSLTVAWFDDWVWKSPLARLKPGPFIYPAVILPKKGYWLWAAGFYLLARVGEVADKAIYRCTLQISSGHTVEHLCVTVATALSTLALARRSMRIEPESSRSPVYHQLKLAFMAGLWVPRMICLLVLDIATVVPATLYELIILLWELSAHLVSRFLFLVMTSEKQLVSKTRHHGRQMMMQHPGLWGMDDYKCKVHKFLESELPHDSVFGLWGISGVGKTRLLRLISACYGGAASPFRHIIALKDGTVRDMQHDLAAFLNLDWNIMSSLQEHCRAYIFSEHLKRGSFLLLLDDVQDGDLDLASIGLPMPLGQSQKVILTSKSQAACGRMGCTEANTVEMKCLGEEDAWNLFKYKVGVEITDANAEIHKIAKLMVSACGGLPRAICSIGMGIAGVTRCGKNRDDWWIAYERFKANKLPGCSALGIEGLG